MPRPSWERDLRVMRSKVSSRFMGAGIRGRLLVVALFLCLMCSAEAAGHRKLVRPADDKQRLDVHRHLRRFNKAAIKSIQSPDGDIIDCVHITNQPAFDHPFLKNHSLKLRPASRPEGLQFDDLDVVTTKENAKPLLQLWHRSGIRCPEGTIPIRRTREADLLRASSMKRYGRKHRRSTPVPPAATTELLASENGHQHAIAYVTGDKYYGAKATINVWRPKIQNPNEFSLSQLWILGGYFGDDLNSVEAGWQVSPNLYGDNQTRLFTYWTSDAYQETGCYNLLCSGFIQVSSEIAIGASIFPVSSYGGSQYDITLMVWKDPKEGNWWLQYGADHVIGYWPAFMFPYLSDSGTMVEWGGEVVNLEPDGEHTSTQMGSGHFPVEGFGKAGYFRNLLVVDETNSFRAPVGMSSFTEKSACYDVQIYGSPANQEWGHFFFFGGPGKNSDCRQ